MERLIRTTLFIVAWIFTNYPWFFGDGLAGILIGGYNDNTEYVIEVTEIDPEDVDYWQMTGQVEPTNYTAGYSKTTKEGSSRWQQ